MICFSDGVIVHRHSGGTDCSAGNTGQLRQGCPFGRTNLHELPAADGLQTGTLRPSGADPLGRWSRVCLFGTGLDQGEFFLFEKSQQLLNWQHCLLFRWPAWKMPTMWRFTRRIWPWGRRTSSWFRSPTREVSRLSWSRFSTSRITTMWCSTRRNRSRRANATKSASHSREALGRGCWVTTGAVTLTSRGRPKCEYTGLILGFRF